MIHNSPVVTSSQVGKKRTGAAGTPSGVEPRVNNSSASAGAKMSFAPEWTLSSAELFHLVHCVGVLL